ncbi:MAG: DUF4124 domain-containing protein [Alteromonadales bacterium]|nr:DUF4124 domain-containing protein [Alteromonadales bacterium]
MKYILLILSIMVISPIASSNTTTTTVFSWVDDNGVMHFTDKKPKESVVAAELLASIDIEVANVPEAPRMNTQPAQLPDVAQNVSSIAHKDWTYKELSPTCRWIAKRISLLENMIEQNSDVYDEIFRQELSKRQKDWNSQNCFAGIS